MAMYTVTKKPLAPNTVWDAETEKPLCRFEKGKFVTDDERIAKRLEAMGHAINRTGNEAGTEEQKSAFRVDESVSDGESKADTNMGTEDGESQSQHMEDRAGTDMEEAKKTAGSRGRK